MLIQQIIRYYHIIEQISSCDSIMKDKPILPPIAKKKFEKIYGLAGNHSGIQICSWTKRAIRDKGVCYKQIFYGAECHRCAQMSPALAWCQENCIFCWRPMEWMKQIKMDPKQVDEPEEIIQKTVEARKKLIVGIGGAHDVNKKLFQESLNKFPSHWAISLSGEPTIYPKLAEMIKQLKSNPEVKTVYLVTNGQEPKRLKELKKKKSLPTQLYISVSAPNEILFKKINKSLYEDGWKKLLESLEFLSKVGCSTVIRFTVIKGLNDKDEYLEEYAKLFEKSKTRFIEVKSYMFIGLSRDRLKIENMPYYKDIVEYSKKLAKHLPNYKIVDAHPPSRIVLFKRK